jgi:hypothetical protein
MCCSISGKGVGRQAEDVPVRLGWSVDLMVLAMERSRRWPISCREGRKCSADAGAVGVAGGVVWVAISRVRGGRGTRFRGAVKGDLGVLGRVDLRRLFVVGLLVCTAAGFRGCVWLVGDERAAICRCVPVRDGAVLRGAVRDGADLFVVLRPTSRSWILERRCCCRRFRIM